MNNGLLIIVVAGGILCVYALLRLLKSDKTPKIA